MKYDHLPFKIPDPAYDGPPDINGCVEGWRVWGVVWNAKRFEAPRLHSATYGGYYWAPKAFAEAECSYPDKHDVGESVPGHRCSCGFYSAKSLEHLLSLGYHHYDLDAAYKGDRTVMVLGRLANWGRVVEGPQGWRAQYAYPVKLWVPFEAAHLAKPIEEKYGVEVRLKNILNAGQGAKSPFLTPNPNREEAIDGQ